MNRPRITTVLAVVVLLARPLVAQCPDGSPPPCAGARPAAPDLSRIAVFPFRVTSADTLLGEGMAELLAPEFTGERSPRAVNMGSVLRAWRRAGGGPRTPLGQAGNERVARELGAGRFVEGSIVGLGSRIAVTASVISLPGGATRRVGPVSGPGDSLQSLVGRVASALLGATGDGTSANLRIQLTDSPEAMRAYLEGLALYRFGDFQHAAAAFERAFSLDSTFARAALMRMETGLWGPEGAGWDSVTWRLRDRLSAQDRVFLTGFLGDHFPAWRSPEANLADRRRAANLLPESPEAQFWLGDYLFHFGSANDIADNLASARAQLERAYALEPSYEALLHLVEIAVFTSDTVLLRRIWGPFERTNGDSGIAAAAGRVAGPMLGDTLLERRAAGTLPRDFALTNAVAEAALPGDVVARIYFPSGTQSSGSPPLTFRYSTINTGRLADLLVLQQRTHYPAEDVLVEAGLFAEGDSSVAAAAAERLAPEAAQVGPWRVCVVALWRQHIGMEWDRETVSLPRTATCTSSLGLLDALRRRAPDTRARTIALDSTVRWSIANGAGSALFGFEPLILARAWEVLGEPARALAAVRLRSWAIWPPPLFEACVEREQGRLAALLGDTASAIRSYRRYLRFRRDADPIFIPQRDSVAAELARLERR